MPLQHQRVMAALQLEEPDRVPVMDLMNELSVSNEVLGKKPSPMGRIMADPRYFPWVDRLLKLANNPWLFDREVERFAHRGAAAAVRMGYDAAWISYFPVLRIRSSRVVDDIFGRRNDMYIDSKGNIANPIYREGLIKSPQDWEAWDKKPILRLPSLVNRVFSDIQRDYGERLFIFGFANYGLFESTWQAMGLERFVVAVRRERNFIRRMIRFYTDLFCMLMEAMADAGIPGVIYTDDLAYKSGPMINHKLIEELFGESYRRITETAHALGLKIVMHSCGNVTSLLEWFCDCGFDGVHPLEPTAGVELAQAKQLVGKRICLIGNIDVTHILVDATREEFQEAVRRAIADAGEGGGYILAPDHSHPQISVERLRWMVEAVERYGRYPLELGERW